MKLSKSLYQIAFIAGILICAVGVFLQLTNQTSGGNSSQYDGTPLSQTLDGLSTIYLGVLIRLVALISWFMYRREKKNYQDLD